MTIRCGMSGEVVRQVEQLLASLKLYNGPIDSCFGGGVESAVKNFQRQRGLPPTGILDAASWALMFPGVAAPASPFATAPLVERCLALTGSFETGRYHPDCFCAITGDFDGQGISFGVLQWNVGQGSLQPIFKQMFERYPAVCESIFNEYLPAIKTFGSEVLAEQLAFSRSIQVKGQIREPWLGMLVTLGRSAECQHIQACQASRLFDQALQLCADLELSSERAAALLFDVVTQNGSLGANVKAQILYDYDKLTEDNEVSRMCIVANRVSDASRSRFVADVRNRKLTIAKGSGIVHGLLYHLADMFNITLKPLATGAAAAGGRA